MKGLNKRSVLNYNTESSKANVAMMHKRREMQNICIYKKLNNTDLSFYDHWLDINNKVLKCVNCYALHFNLSHPTVVEYAFICLFYFYNSN